VPSQFAVASGSGATLSTATDTNVQSQMLQPGTYMVWGQVDFDLTASTATKFKVGISLVSATMPSQMGGNGLGSDPFSVTPVGFTVLTDTISEQCGPTLLTLTTPTTVYLVAKANFSLGSIVAYGTLNALILIGAGHNLVIS
jgi:hypothetical protein